MHVLSRKSFAGPSAAQSKTDSVAVKNRKIDSCMEYELFGPSSLLVSYILSLAKQRH